MNCLPGARAAGLAYLGSGAGGVYCRWWQWAAFAEPGRVAPDWDLSELHKDMKWSAGVSTRAMIVSGIGRMDIATSDESTQIILMPGQPF